MKTVLITGAGSGLGKALSKVFIKNNWETLALPHEELDVTDQKSIAVLVKKLNGKPIDVLINNAGIYDGPADGEPTAVTIPLITNVFQVNSVGPWILANSLLPNLLKGKERLIVTISSIMGAYRKLDDYYARHWSYGASKMAVNYAMLSFNREHPGIKCALVHPGWVKTKIGGKDAVVDPRDSAEGIYKLIEDHKSKLPVGKLINYQGNIIEL